MLFGFRYLLHVRALILGSFITEKIPDPDTVARCRKRSLVVLMTNVIDEVHSEQISKYLASLARHHLPLGVMLRDLQMFDAVDMSQQSTSDLYRGAAAANLLNWRHQVIRDLEHNGVLVVDEFPERLTAPLINRYLDIKARHLL